MVDPKICEQLISLARETQKNAYIPYSKFAVGAALITEDGDIFTGCNVENISYGLCNCGERTAIFSMVAKKGPTARIKHIAVTTAAEIACSPCGACRQVIQEFGPNCTVTYKSEEGFIDVKISQLLPGGFSDFVDSSGKVKSIQSGQ
ncbi:Cytidine deaminase [Candidatus Bealeia paramacronuclearis]|uniref:Cytidine deaminase n=1 Tax=Candidatus Bealeia paramacronuclearis TaxID=1921001 RepID=A0ABZ2C263_9PROT|nr:Cytidine deaminase [Candidatus Bealeia paramacronuclearis]